MGQRMPKALSDRHLEVLALTAEGLSNAEIGARLFLGVNTIKSHQRALLHLLAARNRVHAVSIAHQRGLIGTAPPISEQHGPRCASHNRPKCNCDRGGQPYTPKRGGIS